MSGVAGYARKAIVTAKLGARLVRADVQLIFMAMSSVLEFKEATIKFGGLTAVAPLSFAIPAGQLAAIIGPNGAGKTTVFNLITGVYAPTGGEIWVEGQKVASANKTLKPHQLVRRGIARTFQNIRLFGDLSVADNVRAAFASRAQYGLAGSLLQNGTLAKRENWIDEETERVAGDFWSAKSRPQ